MLYKDQKKLFAIIAAGFFLLTFGSFLISSGVSFYDNPMTDTHHQIEPSYQNHVANSLLQVNNSGSWNFGFVGNIVNNRPAFADNKNSNNLSNNIIQNLEYNITIHETGLNLSIAMWQVKLVAFYGTPESCLISGLFNSTGSTINLSFNYFSSSFNYELIFSVAFNRGNSSFVPLNNLDIKFSPSTGKYSYSYTVNFPSLYLESFTFTDTSTMGTEIFGTISFNNTSAQLEFSQYAKNYSLVLPKGYYDLVFIYNFSKENIAITVSSKGSYSVTFKLYAVEIDVDSEYSLSGDQLLVEAEISNLSFPNEVYLPMQACGNKIFEVNVGNNSFKVLLIFPNNYTKSGYSYQDTMKYELAQEIIVSGHSLILIAKAPELTTHMVSFSGVSGEYHIMLKYYQAYAFGYTTSLYYNSTTGTMSESILTLASPVLIDAIFVNSTLSYSYQESYYFNPSPETNITIALHKVSVCASGTVSGSITSFAVKNNIPPNIGTTAFGCSGQTFFSTGSDNATLYLPSSGFQIEVTNEYSNPSGNMKEFFTENITKSVITVRVDFLKPHDILLSIVLENIPKIELNHYVTIYGMANGIKFTSSSDTNCFVSPYGNVSVFVDTQSIEDQLDISYCSIFYTDLSVNSLAITIQPLYLHTIEITNPLLNFKGNYTFNLVLSESKLSIFNFLAPYENLTCNVSLSSMTINNGSGRNLNITLLSPNGSFNACYALIEHAGPSEITGLYSISDSFFYLGDLDLSSSSVLFDNISIPKMSLATVEVDLNGLPLPVSLSTFSISSGNYFGLIYSGTIYTSESSLLMNYAFIQILLPVSTSVHATIFSCTPFDLFYPDNQTCTVSNQTCYHTGLLIQKSHTFVNKYEIDFVETGLTSGTSWQVTFNGTTNESTTDMITFTVANGSYQFTIASISGYTVSPASGTVIVNGSSVTKDITFTVKSTISKYTVSFIETGLPAGTSWSITIDSMTNSSTGNTISFMLSDGNYSYMSTNTANYTYSGPATVLVKGSNVTIDLTFSKKSTTTTPPPSVSFSLSPVILYAIAAVVVVGIVGFVFRAMRKR